MKISLKILKGQKPITRGVIFGIVTILIYLSIVILTTPALSPFDAISAAFHLNSIVIIGMGIGIGLQMYISEKGKNIGCNIKNKHSINGGSTAATSFFSFFSLVPLGCCGWWLYALSLLPGVLGVGATAVLIEHSQILAYVGLTIIYILVGLNYYRLRKNMNQQK